MRTGICGVKIWSTFQFYIKRIVFGILDLLITADIIENTGESLDGISSIRIGDPSRAFRSSDWLADQNTHTKSEANKSRHRLLSSGVTTQ